MTDGHAMKVLIVDDEELARLRIKSYLARTHPTFAVQEAEDGVDALVKIGAWEPDLVLLDIEMPGLGGFDMLRQLPDPPFQVVFQTAYDQFAVKAFDANACDYLLKPFTDERLEKALAKAVARVRKSEPATIAPLAGLDRALLADGRYLERFVVAVGSRSKVIEASEVHYFLSESHVTRIMLDKIDFAYDHSLTYLEEHLDPERFLRVHRNVIVALGAVASVQRGDRAAVTLKSGQELAVSRERKSALLAALGAKR